MRLVEGWFEVRAMGSAAAGRYEAWLAAAPDLARVLLALEHREWRDDPANDARRAVGPIAWRLDRDRVERLRAAAVAAIEAAGGRVELGEVVVAVVAGELRISMK